MSEPWQLEKEFLDYMLVSLHGASADEPPRHRGATASQKSPVKPEAGLEHLDNLCKLMEQLGELRDANSRLQKRVQYLEDMKTLQEMHQELDLFVRHDEAAPDATPADKNTEADRSLDSLDGSDAVPDGVKRPANKKPKGQHHMKFKKPALLKYRERSKSVGFDEPGLHDGDELADVGDVDAVLHAPVRTPSHRAKTKVSKWTRVKEAFRWEKAHVDPSAPAAKAKPLLEKDDARPARQPTALSPESPTKSSSPVFRLGRRRRSDVASSSSSSSLSECPLESEILKSYADAQELPFFHLEKRASSPEVKTGQMGSVLSLQPANKRLHRQSTISCDGNFATTTTTTTATSEPPGRRKTAELEFEALAEEAAASGCQPEPRTNADEWPAKWGGPASKNGSLASPLSQTDSRNSLSVPSTPMQHQAFTFDVFTESGTEISRENSPGARKRTEAERASPASPATSNTLHPGAMCLMSGISPEFRKKVEAWERLKSGQCAEWLQSPGTPPTPTTPRQKKPAESGEWCDVGRRRGEPDKLPPAFKKKLAEWEIRKAVAGKSDQNVEELHKILPHDFNRKLQEWERMKQQASASKLPASPGLERQCSGKQQPCRGKHVKATAKTDEVQRGDKQKEKDLQWLEKELQKIEREKLRLEREREKYIERESRLEKIREAMKQPGHGPQREICIRTSTGEFRFQGLSRKFTKKLFQWEEQKGIRPEASTIALLDGAFDPGRPSHHHHLHHHHASANEFGSAGPTPRSANNIGRSKSESSVADLVCASVHSQPSSISLNDAETGADFDRQLNAEDNEDGAHGASGPGALLVEVEDVTEESAAVVEIPDVTPQAPVYSIAHPAEFHYDDREPHFQVGGAAVASTVQRNDSVRTEASFKLLEENLSLLDRLRAKGEIVKYLELQMNSIDGDMAGVANTQTEQMDRLKAEEETCLSDHDDGTSVANAATIERLKQRIIQLESKGKQLKAEKENIQTLYRRQCSQQAQLVHHLVEKMQQLRGIGSDTDTPAPPLDPDVLQRLNTLTAELLHEAQTLESAIQPPPSSGEQESAHQSAAVVLPERLSLKANQLKEEFERLRSLDSEDESDIDSDDEKESYDSKATNLPSLPPVSAEMSSAARKKIFVETRRLVFAPLDSSSGSEIRSVQASPSSNEEGTPWRRQKLLKETPPDALPWRKNSLSTTPDDGPSDCPRPATAIRNTAPNIRRMIDKYHQKVTGSKERPPTLHFRPRDLSTGTQSSPSTPPATEISNIKKPTPRQPEQPEQPPGQQSGFLTQPMQLSKSMSTGTIGSQVEQPQSSLSSSTSGVLRSKSGHQFPVSQAATCMRNPSFFRKSPLDPSIDELLQKYRGRRQGAIPSELPKGPAFNAERMLRIRQAREAFLSSGSRAPLAETPADDQPCSSNGTAFNESPAVIPDITLAPCEGEQEKKEGAAEKMTNSAGLSGSCPSSPSLRRNNSGSLSGSGSASPLSRHSWLKQPAKFFFSKPKTP